MINHLGRLIFGFMVLGMLTLCAAAIVLLCVELGMSLSWPTVLAVLGILAVSYAVGYLAED